MTYNLFTRRSFSKGGRLTTRIFLALIFISGYSYAQSPADTIKTDTAYSIQLREIKVTAKWKNDTDRYHYNQMKFYVTTILPYLNAATKLFVDINNKLNEEGISRKDRRRYVNSREDEVRDQFEDKVKKLNVTQATLLMKLVARQTNVNIYSMLTEFKNPLTAVKWQVWARVNGLNLDRKYDPANEPDLENIMYELGYPLPDSYATN